ncbi:putative pre-mRNA-splicing factor prp1 [Pseudovirgaria hyperparasitica]|uniref:Putative pre-mRNA-splicing factor prp1 n=1 Tax=Pseudovirgaria hyperparasitica TaxID=470096 RepID=A0A6A6WCN8_9PEZI|nr:putative pre-mRNA-splicing factor prp1 [Pseudovirgaria hyperparasitica]KAF2759949.1 putative pre-mRNA-splicing factor prp1 [Pseudovirgaria hyperparasitica]
MSGRKDFLSQAAPENYVAGLGRGATGFTTRSDLGPAREGPSEDQIKEVLAKRAAAAGIAPPTAYGVVEKKKEEEGDAGDDDRYQDPENEVGLFANGNFDRDDDEADRIYQDVDERMDRRRKARREKREQEERDEYERNNPKIQQQFADLKRELSTVTDEEWAALPSVGDLTGKNRRAKQNLRQRFYAVPDSVIAGARDANAMETAIESGGPGSSGDGTMTNFADIGAARDKVLQVRLDQAAQGTTTETTSGTATTVDPKGYLTSLAQSESGLGAAANVGDLKRVRTLMESVVKTNPKHGPAWVAAARLEEHAGRALAARDLLSRACEHCPKSEDVWLERIRINDRHNARIIAANAIKNLDTSVPLWLEATRLEEDPRAKKRVLRQALDRVPTSEKLWKMMVNEEENVEEARLLLAKAVEMIPKSEDLWLALARLETADNARIVLNKARIALPTSYRLYLAGARMMEQTGDLKMASKVISGAVKALARQDAMLKRTEWITEAEKCEEEGAIHTCQSIIRETLGWSLQEDDTRIDIWLADARSCTNRGLYITARAIYAYALRVFYNKPEAWLAAANLERLHGDKEDLLALLEQGVEACPQAEELWMQFAREKRANNDLDGARMVLAQAFVANPGNENIYLNAVQFEATIQNFDMARQFLAEARDKAGTDRVWMKSVAFERQQRDLPVALDLVNQALSMYSGYAKLWMQKGQIYEDLNKLPQAREAYTQGTRNCPKSVPLWLLASRIEEKAGVIVKARSVLDRARLAIPKSPELWTESIRLERRANQLPAAQALMAQALREVPNSGLLWSERIWYLEARTHRKARSLEAIKKAKDDPVLFCTVARIFWAERKLDKAATWFEKAVGTDPDWGDGWAWYVKFLAQHGTDEKQAEVREKCVQSAPRHGEVWQRLAKKPEIEGMGVEDILALVVKELE